MLPGNTSSRSMRGSIFTLLCIAISVLYFCNYLPNPRRSLTHGAGASVDTSWITWSSTTEARTTKGVKADKSTTSLTEAHEGGPRIRKATMIYDTDKYNAAYERSVGTHLQHGEQWGHPTHILRHDIVDAGFFNKPAFLLGMVINEMAKPYGQRAEWIVWFDADSIILNPNVSWQIFLPPEEFSDIHILGSRDQNGFNAGVFLMRVHPWTVKMLSEVVALRQLQPDVDLPFFDQSAIKWVYERDGYRQHFLYQPHNWWNSFGLAGKPYPTDAFILHFAGVDCCNPVEPKGVTISRWIDQIDNEPEQYKVPLANTTLPQQVSQYWANLLKTREAIEQVNTLLNANPAHEQINALQEAQDNLRQNLMQEADEVEKLESAMNKLQKVVDLFDAPQV